MAARLTQEQGAIATIHGPGTSRRHRQLLRTARDGLAHRNRRYRC
jgi:hypothetical protein